VGLGGLAAVSPYARLVRQVQATADGNGNITLTLPSVPSGRCWTGNLCVTGANNSALFTLAIGAGAQGVPVLTWVGLNSVQNVQAYGGEQLTITGTSLIPGLMVTLNFVGFDQDQGQATPVIPTTGPVSLQTQVFPPVSSAELGGLLAPATGHTLCGTPPTTPVSLTSVYGNISLPSLVGIIITALSGNAASVFVGSETVNTSSGQELVASQSTTWPVQNVNQAYLCGSHNTDGVSWAAF